MIFKLTIYLDSVNGAAPENGLPSVDVPNKFDCLVEPDIDAETTQIKVVYIQSRKMCANAAVSTDAKTRGIFDTFQECRKMCIGNISSFL